MSIIWASGVALVVKNPPADAGDVRDAGLIPGSEDPLEEGMAIHSSILAWRSPWPEEPGGLQPMGLQSQTRLSTHGHVFQQVFGQCFSFELAILPVSLFAL